MIVETAATAENGEIIFNNSILLQNNQIVGELGSLQQGCI
jgi:hypothetical protein